MKVITVKQPWASLIIQGIKDIENRTWKCPEKYIGQRILIHAGNAKQYSLQELLTSEQLIKANEGIDMNIDYDALFPKGAIIGSVEIIDCVINHSSIWAEKSNGYSKQFSNGIPSSFVSRNYPPIYNWVLKNPIKFPQPIPCKGKLSFWEYAEK